MSRDGRHTYSSRRQGDRRYIPGWNTAADRFCRRLGEDAPHTSGGGSVNGCFPGLNAGDESRTCETNRAVIPAGTQFLVRTIDFIDVDKTQAGMKFRGTLDDPIMMKGNVIVPRGADVGMVAAKVQQVGGSRAAT